MQQRKKTGKIKYTTFKVYIKHLKIFGKILKKLKGNKMNSSPYITDNHKKLYTEEQEEVLKKFGGTYSYSISVQKKILTLMQITE